MLEAWLQNVDVSTAVGDFDSRTILSFPHTAIEYSGPLQARVAGWLCKRGFKRVVTLGVLHGSLVPAYRIAADKQAASREREAAYAHVCGAFLLPGHRVETPFGDLDVATPSAVPDTVVRVDAAQLLGCEFSLDTFHAVLRLAADVYHVNPPAVLPIYVGMMRHPLSGAWDSADALARWLRALWDGETAIVTTADVVHYGTYYGSELVDLPLESLAARFLKLVETLWALLGQRRFEQAFDLAEQTLKADHREMLAVLSTLLGSDAGMSVEAFSLSDYASILQSVHPCLVASALIAYQRRVNEQESRLNER